MTIIAILGQGEAGRLYARGLSAAGAEVRRYDPFLHVDEPGTQVAEIAEAVDGADLVLSLTGAHAAVDAARDAVPHMRVGAVYADLNTGARAVKEAVAALAVGTDVVVADVAVLAPVPRAGHRTPAIASGPGAAAVVALLTPLGVPVSEVGAQAGDAAERKLLRSVFMKGLATLVIEGLGAARAFDAEEWLRHQIAGELGPEGDALLERLVTGTYEHAHRRAGEVADALAALEAADVPTDMTRATQAWFDRILAEREAAESD